MIDKSNGNEMHVKNVKNPTPHARLHSNQSGTRREWEISQMFWDSVFDDIIARLQQDEWTEKKMWITERRNG